MYGLECHKFTQAQTRCQVNCAPVLHTNSAHRRIQLMDSEYFSQNEMKPICCWVFFFSLQLETSSVSPPGPLHLLGVWAAQRRGLWLVPLHRCVAHSLHLPRLFQWWCHGSFTCQCAEAGLGAEGGSEGNALLQSGVFQVSAVKAGICTCLWISSFYKNWLYGA